MAKQVIHWLATQPTPQRDTSGAGNSFTVFVLKKSLKKLKGFSPFSVSPLAMNPNCSSNDMNRPHHIPVGAASPQSASKLIQLAMDDLTLKPLSPEAVSPLSQARAVLALLVHCYILQIYSSKKIAALAARDPDFPWLWWENFPDAPALRRFRVENQTTIHRCLTRVMETIAVQKKFAGTLTRISSPQFAEEARRRITMAAFVDSVELGGK